MGMKWNTIRLLSGSRVSRIKADTPTVNVLWRQQVVPSNSETIDTGGHSMDHDKLSKMLDQQIAIEEKAIKAYEEAMEMIGNFAYRLIFEELLMDSMKHKRIFEVIKQNLALPPSDWDLAMSKRIGEYISPIELEKHIKLEEGMINTLKKQTKTVKDETIRHLLEHVLEDENRHHSVLKKLIAQL
jgi:rubrerythrin